MADPTITNNSTARVVLANPIHQDDLLTFGGAGTVKAGTILARDTSTLKLVPYVKGGSTNGNGVPCALVDYDVVAAGAGDEVVRSLIGGHLRKDKLIITADGDDQNVDAAVRDQLRDKGLIVLDVDGLAILDNQ